MQLLANTSIDATSCKYKYRYKLLANTSIDTTSCLAIQVSM